MKFLHTIFTYFLVCSVCLSLSRLSSPKSADGRWTEIYISSLSFFPLYLCWVELCSGERLDLFQYFIVRDNSRTAAGHVLTCTRVLKIEVVKTSLCVDR